MSVASAKPFREILREEEVILRGEPVTVRRKHFPQGNNNYLGVGWVLDEDVKMCMLCGSVFGITNRRHHCRCCGDLVCAACAPYMVTVYEISDLGPVRVCTRCCWGQVNNALDVAYVYRLTLRSSFRTLCMCLRL